MELEQKCLHISNQEKKAQEAERESIKFKQVEFIADHVGEVFTGIISGMIERGIFISLLSTQIEGMIGFASMSDSYTINDSRMKAVGNRTKHELKIGQKVEVKIVDVRIDDAEVDMVFAEDL